MEKDYGYMKSSGEDKRYIMDRLDRSYVHKTLFIIFIIVVLYLMTAILEANWDSFDWSPIGTSVFYILGVILMSMVALQKN